MTIDEPLISVLSRALGRMKGLVSFQTSALQRMPAKLRAEIVKEIDSAHRDIGILEVFIADLLVELHLSKDPA